ncbi:hypothetical protein D3C81_2318050 [compost metagenome]
MIAQAENSLEHAEEAVLHAPEGSVGGQGVELTEERLAAEKGRLSQLKQQKNSPEG